MILSPRTLGVNVLYACLSIPVGLQCGQKREGAIMDIGADLRALIPSFNWNIKGIITTDNEIYGIPPIPQVITGIFEEVVLEIIKDPLKKKYNCEMIRGGAREYPELTLYGGHLGEGKIAIDVKTARRDKRNKNRTSRMTLGSYGGYFKNPGVKKPGCVFPYGDYTEHWIIGFIYDWHPDRISNSFQVNGNW